MIRVGYKARTTDNKQITPEFRNMVVRIVEITEDKIKMRMLEGKRKGRMVTCNRNQEKEFLTHYILNKGK